MNQHHFLMCAFFDNCKFEAQQTYWWFKHWRLPWWRSPSGVQCWVIINRVLLHKSVKYLSISCKKEKKKMKKLHDLNFVLQGRSIYTENSNTTSGFGWLTLSSSAVVLLWRGPKWLPKRQTISCKLDSNQT